MCIRDRDSCALPINYSRLISLFRNTNQAFPFDGNRVEAYTLALSMLQSLLRELGQATTHIHMDFYIFEDDAIGRLVRDVLMENCLLYTSDGFGKDTVYPVYMYSLGVDIAGLVHFLVVY